MTDPLARFSPPTREWFAGVFPEPTPVQAEAWRAVGAGEHSLVVAPTGSGKTLAAFLWAIDSLAGSVGLVAASGTSRRGSGLAGGASRIVYVSPLKALGVDVERNLRAPLTGIRLAAERLGLPMRPISVGVRSGDTPARERAALLRHPPDILITTPESLYLMLTSGARETLTGVGTVIVDEIHAVAGTKRGSHLALSLERLDALVGSDVQRVALSATVRPIDRIAAFLGGDRAVTVVAPPTRKLWDVTVRVPVADMSDPGPPPGTEAPSDPLLALGGTDTVAVDSPGSSLWPHVEAQIYETVKSGRSTLVFTNGRRTAERLTGRLNELWAEEHAPETLPPLPARPPAQVMAPVDTVRGAPPVIARAHHGSVSKEARAQIETALKSGALRCVVATSSLELGIDMGAVDRVVQVSAPPSVASALQRVGRAGHVVGAVSRGDVYPLFRGDLAAAVVTTERLLTGEIEELRIPRQPLDVLAQQTVAAAVAAGEAGLDVDEWFATVTRAQPYAGLPRALLDAVVELLTGAYPSADFAHLRARLVLGDDNRLYPRPGALRLAVTSGGTIPDRGLFGVFLAGDEQGPRRVGELDEEMVHESRVGDVFTLGASSWRIEEITRDQVRVSPAPGNTGRLPFWKGEDEGRPTELGRGIGALQREASRDPARLDRGYLDGHTRGNLAAYLQEQRAATGVVPDERTVLLERFRDELGDWRVVIHSPLGRRVLGAWGTIIGAVLSAEGGVDVSPVGGDDGIVLRLPDSDLVDRLAELIVLDPEEVTGLVTAQVGGTSLFASRFREAAARALLLPRPDPGRRAPLWQQRQRAAQLLEVARHYPRFPIILETIREVTQDVYDVPALVELMRALRSGSVRLVEVVTERPSPFAASLLFRYPGAFIYDGDVPLAERRAALLSLDPELLAAALGTLDLREVLDPDIVAEVVAELRHLTDERRARTTEQLADLPRLLGPIPLSELPAHVADLDVDRAVEELAGRVAVVQLAGVPQLVSASDVGLLRDALGVPVPAGYAAPSTPEGRDPLTQLIARYARTHGPFTAAELAADLGLGPSTVLLVLERESAGRRLTVGRFTSTDVEYVDPEVLRRLRSRSLAKARSELQPVSQTGYVRFLASGHQLVERPASGPDEVLLALQRLAGAALPASAWETHVLPTRLRGYSSAHLDQLIAEGEVLVRIVGSAGPNDPLVALVPADDLGLVGEAPQPPDQDSVALAAALAEGDGTFGSLPSGAHTVDAWWRAAEQGAIAPVSFAPVRARIGGSTRAAHKSSRPDPRRRARIPRLGRMPASAGSTAPAVGGRWYRVRDPQLPAAERALALASSWLSRFGVITRGGVTADGTPGGFAAAYRLLSELEQAGKVLRGYLVDGLGGAQFSTTDVVGDLRAHADSPDQGRWPSGSTNPTPVVLAALDPANPYGSVLPWPEHATAHPSRAAGALVVVADGVLLAHLTRGGRVLTLFGEDRAETVALVVTALRGAAAEGRMQRLRIEEVDGERVGASGLEQAMLDAGARLTPKGVTIEAPRA
ncbi:ATP-dependent helicase Lhr and Lhr-like helicase [Tessaracoccus bendigoensis DSM 12906]|uniref:ATP-dependent helicase Lhr and Lhr-like helicase n=1 Tax=Tessaracoccus bendigoensis DSM 12906 TaxID=1123357 RepID=A0A1M6DED4_9ACTN|nr:DEAD/DEAH box helicase [Tessaracoccus bendigoensis]SHI71654.1 ATP-dependent helicase Lhr and Lhr-like helicase [Tessaracoccus bendigoensis DSM 12906]